MVYIVNAFCAFCCAMCQFFCVVVALKRLNWTKNNGASVVYWKIYTENSYSLSAVLFSLSADSFERRNSPVRQ